MSSIMHHIQTEASIIAPAAVISIAAIMARQFAFFAKKRWLTTPS